MKVRESFNRWCQINAVPNWERVIILAITVILVQGFFLIFMSHANAGQNVSLSLPPPALEGKGIDITYHYAKKAKVVSADPTALVLHYPNGVWVLKNSQGQIETYGVYVKQGSWKDKMFTATYLTIPSKIDIKSVIFMQLKYRNDTHHFEEAVVMPDGKRIKETGRFEFN